MESLVSAEILATADTRQAAVRGRSAQRRRDRPRRLPARSLALTAVGALVVALLPGGALPIPARTQTPPAQPADGPASGDWTQFHNGPAHLGTNSAETGISASNVDALGIAWTAAMGGETFSSPAVANGVIYVGSRDHKLYAFAAGCAKSGGSCVPQWTATTGG
jgi:outer membrane protein assembly factor BamB